MELLLIIMTVLGLSADAIAMSLTSGFFIKHIKINKALKIALFFGFFQTLMPLIGWMIGLTVIDVVNTIGSWISFVLLSILGIKMIDNALKSEQIEVVQKINPLENITLLVLAFNSSLDELALGFVVHLSELSITMLASLLGIITFVLSFLGVLLSHQLGNAISQKIQLVGGILLIIIGTRIFWEHLFEQIVN